MKPKSLCQIMIILRCQFNFPIFLCLACPRHISVTYFIDNNRVSPAIPRLYHWVLCDLFRVRGVIENEIHIHSIVKKDSARIPVRRRFLHKRNIIIRNSLQPIVRFKKPVYMVYKKRVYHNLNSRPPVCPSAPASQTTPSPEPTYRFARIVSLYEREVHIHPCCSLPV